MADDTTLTVETPAADLSAPGPVDTSTPRPADTSATGAPADTSASADWRAGLPPELRESKTLGKYKGVPDLAKAYVNLEQRFSRSVTFPGPDASPEEKAAFARRLGVPETVEGYEPLDSPPEGVPWNKDIEARFHKQAHGLALTPEQVKGVKAFYAGLLQEGVELTRGEQQQAIAEGMQRMRQQWGPNTDRFVANAQALVEKYGDPEFIQYLDSTKLGNDPRMIGFLARLNESFAEDSILRPQPLGVGPEEAKQKILEHHAKYNAILMDRDHPEHGQRQQELTTLYQIAYNKP